MKKNTFIWMVFLLIIPGYRLCSQSPDKPMMDIPTEFQTLYDELEIQLETVQTFLDAEWDGTLYPVAFCTELLAASPNRGEKILEPQVLEAVKFNLDAFVDLGVTAVSMDIKYPALNHDFPRSSILRFFRTWWQRSVSGDSSWSWPCRRPLRIRCLVNWAPIIQA